MRPAVGSWAKDPFPTPASRREHHTVVVTKVQSNPTVPEPPSAEEIRRALRLMEPIRKIINPKVYGIDNVPHQRALLVGNHTVMGMLDSPLMCAELWEHGIIVRSLGDHAHFKIPMWRDVLTACGVVDGTRAITSELMRRGEVILVYPGGGREVAKRKGERYQLIWKERMGFARLAMRSCRSPPSVRRKPSTSSSTVTTRCLRPLGSSSRRSSAAKTRCR